MTNASFKTLADRQGITALTELESLFDSLPAVTEAFMIGDWLGGVFNTGHVGESQLTQLNWVGKRFTDRLNVNPIVSLDDKGQRYANPIMGSAQLRIVEYRGVSTATMIYDKHPIMDHFRQVDDNTVLGVMDKKGESMPLYFYLQRL